MEVRTPSLRIRETERVRSGNLSEKLIANTLLNIGGQAYVVVMGLAVVPYVVHRLGASLYGLIAVVVALGGFAGLLNLGIGTAISKYASELYWQGQFDRINSLFRTAFTISLIAGIGACSLLIVFRGAVSAALVHGDPTASGYVGFAVVITAVGVLASLTLDPLSSLPVAFQRFDITNRMSVLLSTVRNVGAVAVLALGFFFKAVLVVYLLASAVALLGYVHYAGKLIPGFSLRPALNWSDLKRLIGFSAPVLVAGVSAAVVHRLDRVLVAYFLPIAAVAFYVIPYSLAERTWMGVGNITSVIFPSISELSSMQAQEQVRELYIRATKMVLLAGMPVTIILLGLPTQILQYWVGAGYAARGALTLQLLAGGFFFNILAHVPYVVAQGINRPWISAKYSLINGTANLILFLVLIPRNGIVGAGVGFLVSEAMVMPLFIWEMNRLLNISWGSMIVRGYVRPLACGLGAFGALSFFRSFVDSLPRLIIAVGLTLTVLLAMALGIAIDRRERDGMLRQAWHFLRWRKNPANA